MALNDFTRKVVVNAQVYLSNLLPDEFVLMDYEILPVTTKDVWNFMVTARHVKSENMRITLSLVVGYKDLKIAVDKGFASLYPATEKGRKKMMSRPDGEPA